MKNLFFVFLTAMISCAPPISYVNNVPRSSGLNEKGDLNMNFNLGSDTRGRDKVIQFGAAWSPVASLGLDIEYSGLMKLDNNEESLDNARFLNGSLIYYHTFTTGSSLEFKLGAGTGKVNGEIADNNIPIFSVESISVETKYNTYSLQANYNFTIPNEKSRASIGLRGRKIHFDNYSYIRTINNNSDQSFESENWDVYVLDPFIEVNQEIGSNFNLNYRLSHSFFNETIRDNFRHPFFKKLGITIGVQARL